MTDMQNKIKKAIIAVTMNNGFTLSDEFAAKLTDAAIGVMLPIKPENERSKLEEWQAAYAFLWKQQNRTLVSFSEEIRMRKIVEEQRDAAIDDYNNSLAIIGKLTEKSPKWMCLACGKTYEFKLPVNAEVLEIKCNCVNDAKHNYEYIITDEPAEPKTMNIALKNGATSVTKLNWFQCLFRKKKCSECEEWK